MAKNTGFLMDTIQPIEQKANDTEHLKLLFAQIYDKQDIELKTDLDMGQVKAVTRALAFASEYNVPIMERVAIKMMELLISKDRQGRKEFTSIATKAVSDADDQENAFSKLVKGSTP